MNINCHKDPLIEYLVSSDSFREQYVILDTPQVHIAIDDDAINPNILKKVELYFYQERKESSYTSRYFIEEYMRVHLNEECVKICAPNFVSLGWDFSIYKRRNERFLL